MNADCGLSDLVVNSPPITLWPQKGSFCFWFSDTPLKLKVLDSRQCQFTFSQEVLWSCVNWADESTSERISWLRFIVTGQNQTIHRASRVDLWGALSTAGRCREVVSTSGWGDVKLLRKKIWLRWAWTPAVPFHGDYSQGLIEGRTVVIDDKDVDDDNDNDSIMTMLA